MRVEVAGVTLPHGRHTNGVSDGIAATLLASKRRDKCYKGGKATHTHTHTVQSFSFCSNLQKILNQSVLSVSRSFAGTVSVIYFNAIFNLKYSLSGNNFMFPLSEYLRLVLSQHDLSADGNIHKQERLQTVQYWTSG